MDETEFWEIIDSTRAAAEGDPEDHADLLVERLLQSDPDSVLDFARHFEARYNRSYRWDLWGAAYVLLDGASDDAFDYFRCWLIGQGREVFEGALHEPDSSPSSSTPSTTRSTGTARSSALPPTRRTSSSPGSSPPDLGIPVAPAEPEGTPIDFEDDAKLAMYYPRLWDRFGDDG